VVCGGGRGAGEDEAQPLRCVVRWGGAEAWERWMTDIWQVVISACDAAFSLLNHHPSLVESFLFLTFFKHFLKINIIIPFFQN
jgi:hypothetical protein